MTGRFIVKALLVLAVAAGAASRGMLAVGAISEQAGGGRVVLTIERSPAEAIAEIQSLGGSFTRDEESPNKPVIAVVLRGTAMTDAALEHMKGMNQLQKLVLSVTKVSDAGLEHLSGMSQLRSLDLAYTQVTDAGLKHLKGLTQLQTLSLRSTRVTEAGVKELRQALPNCNIRWSLPPVRGAVILAPGGPRGGFGGPGALALPKPRTANNRAAAKALPMTKEQITQRIERTNSFFKQLDKNHDGKIDADEAKDPAGKPMIDRIFSRLGKEPHYPVAITDVLRDLEACYGKQAAIAAPHPAKPDQPPKGQTP